MKRKILIIITGFLILCFGITFYLNKVFIPVKVKAKLIQFLEDKTKRKIQIQSINYNLLKGVVLRGINVSEENLKDSFLTIKEVSFNPQILPIFLNKKVIIPSLNINTCQATIIRIGKNTWNFSSLFPKQAPSPKKQKFSTAILKFNLLNTDIRFIDKTQTQEFIKNISIPNLSSSLMPSFAGINGNFIIKEAGYNTSISTKAKFSFKEKNWSGLIIIKNLDVAKYRPYLSKSSLNLNKCFFENMHVNLAYEAKSKKLTGTVASILNNLDLNFNSVKLSANNIGLNAEIEKDTDIFKYSGTIDLKNAGIANIPDIKNISAVTGKIDFSNEKVSTQQLSATLFNIPFTTAGSVSNFNQPIADLKIKSNFDLKNIKNILPKNINSKLEKLDGKTSVNIKLSGPLSSIASSISGDIIIADGNIKFINSKIPLEKFQSEIKFNNNTINAALISSILKFNTDLNIKDKIINIPNLKLALLSSNLDFKNTILNITDSKNPIITAQGNINLKLSDLKLFSEKTFGNIQGDLIGKVSITGNINNLDNLSIQSNLSSDVITIDNLRFKSINILYGQELGLVKNFTISSFFYMGNINFALQGKFVNNTLDYMAALEIKNVELSEIAKDAKWKNKKIAGLLNAQTIGNGNSKNLSTLQGQGIIIITDGYLGEMNLFRGLFSILSITNFENIIFKDGGCNFQIKDKSLYTDNLQLISQQLALNAQGHLDFNGELDFTVTGQLNQLPMVSPNPSQIGQIFSTIASVATSTISARITGTLKEPKFKAQANPVEIMKKIPGLFSR